ncbi:MAG: MFS transporter, partial [Mycobacterium sp.]
HPPTGAGALTLPEFLREPFAAAMSQSILLPAFVALFGVIAALFLVDVIGSATTREGGSDAQDADDDDDDDDYVEYILRREPDTNEPARDTEPLQASAWHSVADERVRMPRAAPIGFAHNGFHADDGRRLRAVAQFSRPALRPARRQTGSEGTHARLAGGELNQHYRADPEDPAPGRHSSE